MVSVFGRSGKRTEVEVNSPATVYPIGSLVNFTVPCIKAMLRGGGNWTFREVRPTLIWGCFLRSSGNLVGFLANTVTLCPRSRAKRRVRTPVGPVAPRRRIFFFSGMLRDATSVLCPGGKEPVFINILVIYLRSCSERTKLGDE